MMWLGLYQSASIWLCFGPTSPHSSTVPQLQIGGRPMANKITTLIAMTARKMKSGFGRRETVMGQ